MPKFPYNPFDSSLGFGKEFIKWINNIFNNVGSDLKENKSRVDNLIHNAPQPSEVVDMRVDSDGVEHQTARERLASDQNKINQLFGNFNFNDWNPPSVAKALQDMREWVEDRAINLRQPPYNMKMDGVTDEIAILNEALQHGSFFKLSGGTLRITDTLKLPSRPIVIIGGNYTNLDTESTTTSQIFFDSSVENKPLGISNSPNHKFVNISFRGKDFGTDRRKWSKGFVLNKGTAYGDTDVSFKNCKFYRFSTAIEFEGRGLTLDGNSFVEQWTPVVLKHFNNDETLNPPQNDFQTNIRGFRKFHFTNNEFHAVQGHAFNVLDTGKGNEKYIHQVVVTGNRFDGTGGIWKGHLGGAVITGNTMGKSGGTVYGVTIPIFDLASMQGVTISGNSFAGEWDMSSVLGVSRFMDIVFNLRQNGLFKDINIIGNTFVGAGSSLVYCQAGFTNFNFSGNVIDGVLLNSVNKEEYAFEFTELGNTIQIKDNIIKNTKGVKHDYLAHFVKQGIQNYNFDGNIIDTTFSFLHNLYPWNKATESTNVNYTGNGTTQVFSFNRLVEYVIISDYVNGKTMIKHVSSANGENLINLSNTTVTVKSDFNLSGINYSMYVHFA